MGGLAGQGLQPPQPLLGRRRHRSGRQHGQGGDVLPQRLAPAQGLPGDGDGPQACGQLRSEGLDQPVGGREGPEEGGQLPRAGLALQQGAGEGHALGPVVGRADAGMKPAHPGAEAPAGRRVGRPSVVGDGEGEGGGHGVRQRGAGGGHRRIRWLNSMSLMLYLVPCVFGLLQRAWGPGRWIVIRFLLNLQQSSGPEEALSGGCNTGWISRSGSDPARGRWAVALPCHRANGSGGSDGWRRAWGIWIDAPSANQKAHPGAGASAALPSSSGGWLRFLVVQRISSKSRATAHPCAARSCPPPTKARSTGTGPVDARWHSGGDARHRALLGMVLPQPAPGAEAKLESATKTNERWRFLG